MDLERLRREADDQHRLLRVRDLARFGVTPAAGRRLVEDGWLAPVRPGVVLVGGGAPTDWQRAVAAWLAAGPDAALSHWTAARIHRLACAGPSGGAPIDLTVPAPRHPVLAGCAVHRVGHLPEGDITRRRAVRVTTPVRTLLDLAPVLSLRLLEKTVDEGLIARLWELPELAAAVAAVAGSRRPGLPTLREILAARRGDSTVDSGLEQRAVRALAALAPFETGYEVVVDEQVFFFDLAWPEVQVAAECDGWWTRSRSRSKFDHDRRRNNILTARGWSIAHLTTAMSDDEMRAAVVGLLIRAWRR